METEVKHLPVKFITLLKETASIISSPFASNLPKNHYGI
jgi:hypothetical protein